MKITIAIILLLPIFIACKGNSRPAGIPANADYGRRNNIYQLTENGHHKIWYENGDLYSDCEINAVRQPHGQCKFFAKDTHVEIAGGIFQNGQRNGTWIWNFSDGRIFYKQDFVFGKKKSFWIQTELWGNENGKYERYYYNGQLEERGAFDTGEKVGYWEKFYPDGKAEYTGNYFKDKKIKTWFRFYPDGSKEAVEIFDDNGNLLHRTTFKPDGKTLCDNDVAGKKVVCSG